MAQPIAPKHHGKTMQMVDAKIGHGRHGAYNIYRCGMCGHLSEVHLADEWERRYGPPKSYVKR
jgi:hypothetical protein